MPNRRLLILGGTAEAAALAAALGGLPGLEIVSSLAGRTAAAGQGVAGAVRLGGFGGREGLAAHLRAEQVDMVVDATHPFAAAISLHARLACDATGVARLTLRRPVWRPQPGDHWIEAATIADAAARLPALGRRAFLTVGAGSLAPFAACPGMWFLVRLVDPPAQPPPLPEHAVVLGRGPFPYDDEIRLLRDHAVDVLVTKASGGTATAAKLDAARALGIPVLMVKRPPEEPGAAVESVEAAVEWVEARL